VTGFHSLGQFTGDDWVGVIAILMALTLVIGRGVTNGFRVPRAAWPTLIWMAFVLAGIIAAARCVVATATGIVSAAIAPTAAVSIAGIDTAAMIGIVGIPAARARRPTRC
jgi:hypothetical protein